jgi:putative ABC transport system permease protein
VTGLRLSLRLARRELRGGIRGFRVFLACLALGVAAIAGIGSLSSSVREGLRADARNILGGDADVRLLQRDATPAERRWLDGLGTVSRVVEMRSMAYVPGRDDARSRLLVELKAVDGRYPLYGTLAVDGKPVSRAGFDAALAPRGGVPGALVDPLVTQRLRLKVGDRLRIGSQQFVIRGLLTHEPDRGTQLFTLGPRVMIADGALAGTGLVRPGSLIAYHYRIRLPKGVDPAVVAAAARRDQPTAGWRVRTLSQAAPGAQRFIDQFTLYLTLVGLTALLVGGLGIANGVRAWLDGRTATIATFKCLGASARTVFWTYLFQVIALSLVGIAAGLVIGAVLPALLAGMLESVLPVSLRLGVYPVPLLVAAGYGLLTALCFSLWAVARAREVPPAVLFRQAVAPIQTRPRRIYVVATALLAAALAGLAVATAVDKPLALIFIGACRAASLRFRAMAWAIGRGAAALSRPGRARRHGPNLRFALANIHRPGAPTGSVVLSLGFGVTVLVAIALVQGNLSDQVRRQIPAHAPAFFFIDIQPQQAAAFDAAVKSVPGVTHAERVPMVRARIVRLNGVPARKARVAPDARWAVRSDRGLTYAATPPEGADIVAGKWWPADYHGPPLISFDAHLAEGMGLKVGDTITFNVLGREITATIANLRRIKWRRLGMNFTVIFAPGTLEAAPHSDIAAVEAPPSAELPLLKAVTDRLPNVTAIRVRAALAAAAHILDNIGLAVRATALVTIVAGLLVLAGAIAAGHARRVYDAVVLKVLGATRRRVLNAFLLEYGLLGLATAAIAAALGTLTGYLVLTLGMNAGWDFLPVTAVATALICLVVMLVFGFLGTWRAMSQKPAALLRNE